MGKDRTMSSKTIEKAGYSIDILSYSEKEDERITNIGNESPLIEDITNELKYDDCFWDVGANIGIYTLFADEVIGSGEIHSFEPHPVNAKSLRNNINEYCSDKVTPHEIALLDKEGELLFDTASMEPGEGAGQISNEGDIKVKTRRADELDIESPDVMKIDVEGAEIKVLRGLDDILDNIRIIYLEAHLVQLIKGYNMSFGHITDFVKEKDLEVELMFSRGTEKFLKIQ